MAVLMGRRVLNRKTGRRFGRVFLFLALLCLLVFVPELQGVRTVRASSGKKYVNVIRKKGGKYYYYNAKGKTVKNKWINYRGNRYYFTRKGPAAIGFNKIGKHYYYFTRTGAAVHSRWLTIKGKQYYFLDNYAAAIGWVKIGDFIYCFNTRGELQKNCWVRGKYVNDRGIYDVERTREAARKKSGQEQQKQQEQQKAQSSLEKKLRNAISGYGGTWSVYVKNLNTGEELSINNRKMYAASLIKLFAMGAGYERIHDGRLKESAIRSSMKNMITVSDNWSFNYIVKKVGKGYVNAWIANRGYDQTQVVHGLEPSGNSSGIRTGSGRNLTSVRDCGKFLETVYRGTCVNEEYSAKMLSLLKKQTRRSKIPAGVPKGTVVANKTGETDNVCHDAAIVWSKGADYILVVMVTANGSAWGKNSGIARLSKITYNHFNP